MSAVTHPQLACLLVPVPDSEAAISPLVSSASLAETTQATLAVLDAEQARYHERSLQNDETQPKSSLL